MKIEELLDRWHDGIITKDELRRLTEALKEPEGRSALRADWFLETALPQSLKAAAKVPERKPVSRPLSFSVPRAVALGLAACLVIGLSLWTWRWQASAVTLTQSLGAAYSTSPLTTGQRLNGREVHLSSGLVELAFPRSEASVLIEAPALFRVIDRETLWLESGRLTADVQNGDEQGLRVLTPDSDVLDLGTRFAVDVVDGRGSEVHVFEGKVIAEGKSGQSRDLVEGDAVRLSKSGDMANRELRRATFIHGQEMQQLALGWNERKDAQWRLARDQMRRDPALIAYVDFESDAENPIGRIEGARRVQGRFPGTTAMEFLDEGDHIRLDVEAVTDQLTLMAWVRLDHVAAGVNSIYHTDNWNTTGQVHWMVAEAKQMRLALFGQSPAQESRWPESQWSIIDNLGRWVQLATVYDSTQSTVRFFIDGRFDSEVTLERSPPAVLGPAQIGNWSKNDPRFKDRRLSGRLDELILLRRALSDAEIADWHTAGTPYPQAP